jgi:capsular polysaccharide transport system permease protein
MSTSTDLPVVDAHERARAIATELKRAARKSRLPSNVVSGGGGFQARRGDRLFIRSIYLSFVLFVAIPIIATTIYTAFIASEQYSTEARLSLRSGESSIMDSFAGFAGLSSSQQFQDALLIGEHVRSRAMVEELEKRIDLRTLLSRPEVDFISRFDRKKPIEDLVKYWKKQVSITMENISGIITLQVNAFRPEDSLLITQTIIEISETLVNGLSRRVQDDILRNSRTELARAEKALMDAAQAMQDDRNALGLLDGKVTAAGLETMITSLSLQLSLLEEQAAVQAKYMLPDAPSAREVATRMANLKSQITQLRGQIAGENTASEPIATRISQLERRRTDQQIAQKQYAQAVAAYETARVEASTKRAYLVPFIAPTLAEKALYPRRLWEWSIISVPALLIWSIFAGLAYLIRDYMG